MSKEYLEAFERLNNDDSDYAFKRALKDIDIVGQALKRLEAIDNANPSKALERLYCAGNLLLDYVLSEKHKEDYISVKQALLKAQEQEKEFLEREMQLLYDKNFLKEENAEYKRVLEIIKEKNVDILAIKESKILEEYNRNAWEIEHYSRYNGYRLQLTQEEFDLLKRYLCNE